MVALYTSDGIRVGTYSYDPYGGITEISHNDNFKDSDSILEKNPFRYRSYYFDTETGWYYLNSRYYDPQVKRFINGDSTQLLTNTPENLMQYNLFMYCNGDPVNNVDSTGEITEVLRVIGLLTDVYWLANRYQIEKLKQEDGKYVVSQGVIIGAEAVVGGNISVQVVSSGNGEKGIAISFGAGLSTGIGASVGLISSYYPDFECIDESREWFTNWGGSVVYYLGGDYDIITDLNTKLYPRYWTVES